MKKKTIENTNTPHKEQWNNVILYKHNLFNTLEALDRQKITEYAVSQVINHKVPLLTFGKQGEIYKVMVPSKKWEKFLLVAKKKKDNDDEKYDMRKEFRLQYEAFSSIKYDYVKIPELFWYQEMPNGEQFMVMEFAPWQTLYALLLNKVTQKNKPQWPAAENDREADTNIVRIFWVEKAKYMLNKIETTPYIYKDIPWMKVFSKEQAVHYKKQLKVFIDEMHKKGIYHRDLWGSLRNVLFSEDEIVYIIDFGKAIKKHPDQTDKDVYREVKKDRILEYVDDEEIFQLIDAYTQE